VILADYLGVHAERSRGKGFSPFNTGVVVASYVAQLTCVVMCGMVSCPGVGRSVQGWLLVTGTYSLVSLIVVSCGITAAMLQLVRCGGSPSCTLRWVIDCGRMSQPGCTLRNRQLTPALDGRTSRPCGQ
jgi:hypothetical protein